MSQDPELVKELQGLTLIHHNQPMQDYEEHTHEYSECIMPLFGSLDLSWVDSKREERLLPGRMILIPKGTVHSAVSSDPQGERLILLIDSQHLPLAAPINLPKHQIIVELCFEILHSEDESSHELAKSLIVRILNRLATEENQWGVRSTTEMFSSVQDQRLKHVLEMFRNDFAAGLKMAEVAKSCGMSERTLQRLMKTELAMTPNAVLSVYRIEKAVHLLRSGNGVTFSALEVGYQSLSQFNAQFRSVTGRIPSDFID